MNDVRSKENNIKWMHKKKKYIKIRLCNALCSLAKIHVDVLLSISSVCTRSIAFASHVANTFSNGQIMFTKPIKYWHFQCRFRETVIPFRLSLKSAITFFLFMFISMLRPKQRPWLVGFNHWRIFNSFVVGFFFWNLFCLSIVSFVWIVHLYLCSCLHFGSFTFIQCDFSLSFILVDVIVDTFCGFEKMHLIVFGRIEIEKIQYSRDYIRHTSIYSIFSSNQFISFPFFL